LGLRSDFTSVLAVMLYFSSAMYLIQ
jgi:hypothetical protein